MNQIILVGRIFQDLELKEIDTKKCVELILAIPRSYKNSMGIYETDFIPCVLWNAIAETSCEYCHKGDIVGIKGRLENYADNIRVIAEKVNFLSNNPNNKEQENEQC